MHGLSRYSQPIVAALALSLLAGCAPERMSISDVDDLAQFAAASKSGATTKSIAKTSAKKEPSGETLAATKSAGNVTGKPTAGNTTAKPKLDPEAQAHFDRVSKERNFDAETAEAYQELLASMTPAMREVWFTMQQTSPQPAAPQKDLDQENAAASQKSEVAAINRLTPHPSELPKEVKAAPLTAKKTRSGRAAIQPAQYHEPVGDSAEETGDAPEVTSRTPQSRGAGNPAADNDAISEVRAMLDQIAQLRQDLRERDRAQAEREARQEESDRSNKMLEMLQMQHGTHGLSTSDDDASSILGGLNKSNVASATIAAVMAKNNARKSDKRAPLPGEGFKEKLPETNTDKASLSAPTTTGASKASDVTGPLSAAKLEQLWSQIAAEEAASGKDHSLSLELRKKIFLLAVGDAGAASTPPESLPQSQKGYWKHIIRVLEMTINASDHPRADRQAALINRELQEAEAELGATSVLDLQNATFSSSVLGFGNYVEFESTTFKPNQEVILYVEPQNFASRQRDDGKAFETQLQASYQILDRAGKRVADLDLPPENGVCRQRRRDYYLAYPMHLPKSISEGEYTLQLTMEDKISGKFGQTMLKFAIQK